MEIEKSKRTIIIFCILFILSFFYIYSIPMADLDEIWNYITARGIAMGYTPYSDFNLVQTPLFFMLMALPLWVSRTFLVYRLFEAIALSLISLVTYKLISRNVSEKLSLFFAMLFIMLIGKYVTYNSFLLLGVLTIYLIHKKENKTNRTIFLLGLLSALLIMLRQTSGTILFILEFIYVFVTNKNNKAKTALAYLSGAFIPCFGLLTYLLLNNSFYAFWDNCLFSLLTFGNNYSHHTPRLTHIIQLIIIVFVAGLLIYKYIKTKRSESLHRLWILIGLLTIALPIVDNCHLVHSLCFSIIVLIEMYGNKLPTLSKVINNFAILSAAIAILLTGIFNLSECHYTNVSELKYVPLQIDIESFVELRDYNHIYETMGYKTIFISESKALYSIVDGSFDGPYCYSGITNPVEYVKNIPNESVIIISDSFSTDNWQNPPEIYDYVVNNYTKINQFGIYGYYYVD